MPLCQDVPLFYRDGTDRQVEIEGDRGTGVCCDTLVMKDTGYKDSVAVHCFISYNLRSQVTDVHVRIF